MSLLELLFFRGGQIAPRLRQFIEARLDAGDFAIDENGMDEHPLVESTPHAEAIVLTPSGDDADVGQLELNSRGAVVFFHD